MQSSKFRHSFPEYKLRVFDKWIRVNYLCLMIASSFSHIICPLATVATVSKNGCRRLILKLDLTWWLYSIQILTIGTTFSRNTARILTSVKNVLTSLLKNRIPIDKSRWTNFKVGHCLLVLTYIFMFDTKDREIFFEELLCHQTFDIYIYMYSRMFGRCAPAILALP